MPDKQSMLDLLYTNSRIYLLKTDLLGKYTHVNQYFCERMGIAAEDALGAIGLDHIIPEDHELTTNIVEKCLLNPGQPQKVILRKPLANGEIIHTDWDFTYFPEKDGKAGEIICIGFDVSEIINEKHKELSSLIQSTNAIYWKMDKQSGRFTYMDPKIEKLLGWPADSWTDKHVWSERIHPDDRTKAVSFCNHSTEAGQDHEFEYRALAKNGDSIWLKDVITVIKDNGTPVELIGFMVDISKQKAVQQTLSLQAEILDRVGQSVIATTPEGTVIAWNKMAEQLYKYSKEEALGQSIQEMIPTTQTEEELAAIWEHLQAGKSLQGEYILTNRHGHSFPAEVIHTPFFNEKQELVAIIGVSFDLTEKKKAEEAKALARDLKIKNQELEQFAYAASHDMKEPLRTINSFSELILKKFGGQMNQELKSYFGLIKSASARMWLLVSDLLRYSTIGENSGTHLVNTGNLVDTILKDLSHTIKESKASITVDPLPELEAYNLELGQLFQNLISNAIKFRKPEQAPIIHIKAEEQAKYWVFSVHDNGIGIPEKAQDRIFNIFQRLHHKSEYEGTGIGLAHCRRIAELHQGSIWVQSEEEVGSTFYFSIRKEGL
ncbi:MAG: PAS domain S-box protein [Bacteroidota bacterium]